MAIDFSVLEEATKPAKATPKKDYSMWEKRADETLEEYYKRLAKTRKGGILGTGGLMDAVPEEAPTVEEKAAEETGGKAAVVQSGGNEGGPTEQERFESSNAYDQGNSIEEWRTQGSIDRLRGVDYGLQGLMYGIPGMVLSALDKSAIKSDLIRNGWTEEEAERLVNDPDALGAIHAQGRIPDRQATDRYNYFESGQADSIGGAIGSAVDRAFGTDMMGRRDTQSMLPLSPIPGNNPSAVGFRGLPLFSNARAANIQAAQAAIPFALNPTKGLFDNILNSNMAYEIQAQEEARKAAEEAARKAAEESRARAYAKAQADRQARALGQGSSDSGSSSNVGFSSGRSGGTSSRGYSGSNPGGSARSVSSASGLGY